MKARDDRTPMGAPLQPDTGEAEAAERYLDAWEDWQRQATRIGLRASSQASEQASAQASAQGPGQTGAAGAAGKRPPQA